MSLRSEHAAHIEAICNYLNRRPTYADWVVVSAFYSAYHYVRHAIFPNTFDFDGTKVLCPDLDQYRVELRQRRNVQTPNIHRLVAQLVDDHCNEIHLDYTWLRDQAHTARYKDWRRLANREMAREAKNSLESIKNHCLTMRD